MPEYLLNHLHQISNRVKEADEVLLFLDYDGTLVSFKNRPQDVVTSDEVKTVINSLLQNQKYTVIIVTGRTFNEIKQLLDIDRLSFAALHGLQIELSNGKNYIWKPKDNIRKILENIKKLTEDKFQNEKGIYLEDKELALAFHYRMLAEGKIQDVLKRFIKIIKTVDTSNCLDILHGAKVVEIRPAGWDKGKAVELIMNKVAKSKNLLALYIGDDATDEDAFEQIEKQGITVFVANKTNRSTSAKYWLKDTDDVFMFLGYLSTLKKEV